MSESLPERVRRANPVSLEAALPDQHLLQTVLSMPRRSPHRRVRVNRARLLLAVLVLGMLGIAAASKFAPLYFGADDGASIPTAVLEQLRAQTNEEGSIEGGIGQVDENGLTRLASFDTEEGTATIYAAPSRTGNGFCEVHTIGEEISGGSCEDPTWKAVPSMVHHDSRWGAVLVLVGRLEPPAGQVAVRFEDGASRAASIRGEWWVYVVGGDETQPGHRPVAVVATSSTGAPLAKDRLDASFFTVGPEPG